jgi:hypothetical protein
VRDDDFAEAANAAVATAPDEPVVLADGQRLVPRDFLGALAATAADWPHTAPEIWYGQVMQECFWALVR